MPPLLPRRADRDAVRGLLRRHPVVALLGARQVGKTTLAREVARGRRGGVHVFDLENARDLGRLADPLLALERLQGLVVIDEVQRLPGLFPTLRVLADREGTPARFLVLGSASPELLRQGSETLAGRIAFHELAGFSLADVGPAKAQRLWLRGGFPPAFLAGTDASAAEWVESFIRTFLERDLPQLGVGTSAVTLRRFWTMAAHYHGQTWNGAAIAASLGVSSPTVRTYLDLLEAPFALRVLRPWSGNLSKRLVKSPKVYLADTGILHSLLGLETREDVDGHPRSGASWEGFCLEQVVRHLRARPAECHFWATHGGAELDVLIVRGRKRLGFEFKRSSAPAATKSMRTALEDLGLEEIVVVAPGAEAWPLDRRIRVVGIETLAKGLGKPLRPAG